MPPQGSPWDALLAQNRPQEPIGTLDELMEKKMPTRHFPSCHEGTPDESVRGCPYWHLCDMSYKGLPKAEGGGPRNHCWERIKSPANGGGIVRNVHPCFWGVAKQKDAIDNDELLRVIADEGEEYEELTMVPDTTAPRDQNGYVKWDKKLLKRTVAPFKRLGEEQQLAEAELRASIIARDRKRLAGEREAKLLGLKADAAPTDKRDRRKASLGSKEGE